MNNQDIIGSDKGFTKINSYDWDKNNNFENQIVQIFYKASRNPDPLLFEKFGNLFQGLYIQKNKPYLNKLVQLVCHIRDIEEGKGEYNVAYGMLLNIFLFTKNHQLVIDIIQHFVDNNLFKNKANHHSYGSWKDIKYFCGYIHHTYKQYSINEEDKTKLMRGVINLHVEQIKDDLVNYQSNQPISLAAKWVPRENSHFGFLYTPYLIEFFKKNNNIPTLHSKSAFNHYAAEFRRKISLLNKYLKTPQIFQCSKEWKNLDFESISAITLNKQYKAFLNINKNKDKVLENLHRNDEDRNLCRDNFKEFMNYVKIGSKNINARQINIGQLISDGLEAIEKNDKDLKLVVNNLFNEYLKNINVPDDYIVISDFSSSVRFDKETYNNLLGLSLVLAHKSKLGKRILAFGTKSTWINLDNKNNLCEYLEIVNQYEFFKSSWLGETLDLLIGSLKNSNLGIEDIQKMKLFILSDMQITCDDGEMRINETLLKLIETKFQDLNKGLINSFLNKEKVMVPQLVFWNFNNFNGFPSLYNIKNTMMISGYNMNLIHKCLSSKFSEFSHWTPYEHVENILSKERYDFNFMSSIKPN